MEWMRANNEVGRQVRSQAIADLDEVVRLERPGEPLLARDHTWRARLLSQDGRQAQALAACDAALAIAADDPDAALQRMAVLLKLERHDELIAACDRYLARGEPAVEPLQYRGLARVGRKDFAGAIADYTRALALDPDSPRLLAYRGWAYLFDEAPKPALRDFESAVRLAPSDAAALAGLGLARVRLGQYREAIDAAEASLRQAGSAPEPAALHRAARIFALAAAGEAAEAPRRGLGWLQTADQASQRAEALLADAIRRLPADERATFWREVVLTDPALAFLRRRPSFATLAAWYTRLETETRSRRQP
jgi:tetratricopeptide (TPR) repeat protein